MIRSTDKHQMSRHGRTRGASKGGGFCRAEAPVAPYEYQVGRRVPPGGSPAQRGSAECLTTSSLTNWPGAIAIAARPFHIPFANPIPLGFRDRRACATLHARPASHSNAVHEGLRHSGVLAARRGVQFSLRFYGGSSQSHVLQNLPCRDTDLHERHLSRLSSSAGFDAHRHSERHLEPCSRNRGSRYPR